jgi:hypothetical protein
MNDSFPDIPGFLRVDGSQNDPLKEATAKAVASARGLALSLGVISIAKLTTEQWGLIVSAAIFNWLRERYHQAIVEGIDPELGFASVEPSPRDTAVIEEILPKLADEPIDWEKPLMAWTESEMIGFLLAARRLFAETEHAMKPDSVLQEHQRSGDELEDGIPFQRPSADSC